MSYKNERLVQLQDLGAESWEVRIEIESDLVQEIM